MIAGAAAKIAFELFADGALVEVMALAPHHVDGRHDHAGCAKAALQAVVLAEGLLHRMQPAVGGETLDGGDFGAIEGDRECGAGLDGAAVHLDRAAAALAGVTAHMGAGQAQVIAQELDEQRAPLRAERPELVPELLAQDRIDAGRRLVEEQVRRVVDERGGERQTARVVKD